MSRVSAPRPREVVLHLTGDADLCSAPDMLARISAALHDRPASLCLDVGGLTFCDLRGLDAFHTAARLAARLGVPLRFQHVRPLLGWLLHTFPCHHVTPDVDTGTSHVAPGVDQTPVHQYWAAA